METVNTTSTEISSEYLAIQERLFNAIQKIGPHSYDIADENYPNEYCYDEYVADILERSGFSVYDYCVDDPVGKSVDEHFQDMLDNDLELLTNKKNLENLMKKIIFLLKFFFIVLINVYGNQYTLEELNIPEYYIGTYLPVDYKILLMKYKSHEKAMNKIRDTHYTVIMPTKEMCFSDLRYQDRYVAKLQNVKKWEFKTQNEIKIIKDENGFEYEKISDKPFAYTEISNYILTILVKDFITDNFKIKDDELIINGSPYYFRLQPSYTEKNIAFAVTNLKTYFVVIENDSLKLVGTKKINAMQFDPTDEVIYECNKKTLK